MADDDAEIEEKENELISMVESNEGLAATESLKMVVADGKNNLLSGSENRAAGVVLCSPPPTMKTKTKTAAIS